MMHIRHIAIVGGGSSGWMTAALLTLLPDCSITLIEASDIPIIGVGESTNGLPNIFTGSPRLTRRGSREPPTPRSSWRFDSTVSTARTVCLPIGSAGRLMTTNCSDRARRRTIRPIRSSRATTESQPPPNTGTPTNWTRACTESTSSASTSSAAPSYGTFVDKVVAVERAEDGEIGRIVTAASGNIEADLYVDCSGFRSLPLDNTLQEPFQSARRCLPNDRAIAARVPYVNRETELRLIHELRRSVGRLVLGDSSLEPSGDRLCVL